MGEGRKWSGRAESLRDLYVVRKSLGKDFDNSIVFSLNKIENCMQLILQCFIF